jgi:hypothetical protein
MLHALHRLEHSSLGRNKTSISDFNTTEGCQLTAQANNLKFDNPLTWVHSIAVFKSVVGLGLVLSLPQTELKRVLHASSSPDLSKLPLSRLFFSSPTLGMIRDHLGFDRQAT